MLALRLVRGSHPLALLRRLLVVVSAAGVGVLLLSALAEAVARPERAEPALARLLWCLVPFAAAVQLAVTTAGADPATRPRRAVDPTGLEPARLRLLAVLSTVVSGLLGSGLALLAWVTLGRWTESGLGDFGVPRAAGEQDLPAGAVLVLLSLLPLAAGGWTALILRPGGPRVHHQAHGGQNTGGRPAGEDSGTGRPPAEHRPAPAGSTDPAGSTSLAAAFSQSPLTQPNDHRYARVSARAPGAGRAPAVRTPLPAPGGLPWGAALVAVGLAVLAHAGHYFTVPGSSAPLAGALDSASPAVVVGWLFVMSGLVLSGPGLTHLCGRLIAAGQPGVLRLLAGRVLQGESWRVGHPLGALCAVCVSVLATVTLADAVPGGADAVSGSLTVLGAALALGCVLVSLASAVVEAHNWRRPSTSALRALGASPTLLRRAAVLQFGVLLAVLTLATWLVAQLAALPLLP